MPLLRWWQHKQLDGDLGRKATKSRPSVDKTSHMGPEGPSAFFYTRFIIYSKGPAQNKSTIKIFPATPHEQTETRI